MCRIGGFLIKDTLSQQGFRGERECVCADDCCGGVARWFTRPRGCHPPPLHLLTVNYIKGSLTELMTSHCLLTEWTPTLCVCTCVYVRAGVRVKGAGLNLSIKLSRQGSNRWAQGCCYKFWAPWKQLMRALKQKLQLCLQSVACMGSFVIKHVIQGICCTTPGWTYTVKYPSNHMF